MAKTIGTHDGHFHCDEALAVFMLRQTALFRNASLIRSRDPKKLAECDVVVDVGGTYDPERHLYDHHQRGFFETFGQGYETKLSSAGLIYKHFGKEIIASSLKLEIDDANVELLYKKMYTDFIEAIDGNDNGILQYPAEIEPKYKESTSLPARVGSLNPWWNQTSTDSEVNKRFEKAVLLAGTELIDRIQFLGHAWIPARDLVVKAVENRFELDQSGQVIKLEKACPWKEHLFNLEKELKIGTPILYVLYPDEKAVQWRIQAVPIDPNSFQNRKSLPESWRGYRDEELSERAGIKDCVFVHMSGFTGGNKTYDGVVEMAKKSLQN
ncbi:uncharacterized protein VTP21DRAFT_10030 [Calcarisporiella thermophila]|uniref:uncharacterized protein n=1 Tax=Calcarisporiella thermophila TaxID=911321 RepID=UPI003743FA0A